MLTSQIFSDYEFCPRLVTEGQKVEPQSWPIRLALKRYLLAGIGSMMRQGNSDLVCWEYPLAFMEEAGERGYEHTIPLTALDRNAYVLMRDYACWLEGALRLAEEVGELEQVDPVHVGKTPVLLNVWRDKEKPEEAHAFRIIDRPSRSLDPHWNELLASLDKSLTSVTIHAFVLPSPNKKDRLASPLCLCYAHPMTGQMRLSPIEGEKKFAPSWRQIARWETENTGRSAIGWPEWRNGIEKDKCLDQCYQSETFELSNFGRIQEDAKLIFGVIDKAAPRKQELCPRCYLKRWCHGTDEERETFFRSISCPEADLESPVDLPR
jgi:hypothetical protein